MTACSVYSDDVETMPDAGEETDAEPTQPADIFGAWHVVANVTPCAELTWPSPNLTIDFRVDRWYDGATLFVEGEDVRAASVDLVNSKVRFERIDYPNDGGSVWEIDLRNSTVHYEGTHSETGHCTADTQAVVERL